MHPVFVHIFDKRRYALFVNRFFRFWRREGILGLGFFVFDSIDEIEFANLIMEWMMGARMLLMDDMSINNWRL